MIHESAEYPSLSLIGQILAKKFTRESRCLCGQFHLRVYPILTTQWLRVTTTSNTNLRRACSHWNISILLLHSSARHGKMLQTVYSFNVFLMLVKTPLENLPHCHRCTQMTKLHSQGCRVDVDVV